jgi:hypothetical protein
VRRFFSASHDTLFFVVLDVLFYSAAQKKGGSAQEIEKYFSVSICKESFRPFFYFILLLIADAANKIVNVGRNKVTQCARP